MPDADAATFVDQALADKPELIVHCGDLPSTAAAIRDIFAAAGYFFERAQRPVRIVQGDDGLRAEAMTPDAVILETHRLCRPVKVVKHVTQPVTLPVAAARLYLAMAGEWNLQPLVGMTGAPLLGDDGEIGAAEGYHRATGLYCSKPPALNVSQAPSGDDAARALNTLRAAFATFPFSDAPRKFDRALGVETVDLSQPPRLDESAFLVALQTAVCRPSLWLAPGLLLTAPGISGAGTGKGLLARAIGAVAFGIRPAAIPRGQQREELDKRLVAELRAAAPMLFVDNVNATALRSETLACVLTERPARVRVLGVSEMVPLNSTAFVVVTGNALSMREDLARRFVVSTLDARTEDPEQREFAPGFLDEIARRRRDLLAAALTVWRWGRQNVAILKRGRALGSFEQWCEWVRDPLLTLGCADPVERLSEIKAADPTRREALDFLTAWRETHDQGWVEAKDVALSVFMAAGLEEKCTRQAKGKLIDRHIGTRVGGLTLELQKSAARWTPARYRVVKADQGQGTANGDGEDRVDQGGGATQSTDRLYPFGGRPPFRYRAGE